MNKGAVGQSVVRVDALEKVRGKALYPQDLYRDGMLFGKTLRSTCPHAYFTIDARQGEKVPGVVKIFTYKDVPYNHHGVLIKDHEVLCKEKVRQIGDPIAFVVATSERAAQEGMKAIKVTYTPLKAIFDPIEAMEQDAPRIHEGSNIVYHYKLRRGNITKAFEQCHVVVENQYKTNMVDHGFLQPEAGLAYVEGNEIVVHTATQYPHFDQVEIAESLRVPVEEVRVVNTAVGGAFGGREDITLQIHLALAARWTGKPVKAVYSREESFEAHSKRHSMIMYYKTGADKNGKLRALEANIIGDTGAYASWAINILRKAGVHATGPYEIPNVQIDSYAVYTNNPFAGAMRGFGATQVAIAYEQQMDILARRLQINPIAFRLNNCFVNGSLTSTGQVLSEGVVIKTCIEEIQRRMAGGDKGGSQA